MYKTLLTLMTLGVLTAPAFAQMTHGGTDHAMPGTAPAGATMQMGGLDRLSGRAFDRAFLSMMIPHHREAVAMSQAVLGTRDAQVKAWATAIIRDQNREIAQMTALLRGYGSADSERAGMMKSMMGDMASSVRNASDKDRAFVRGMIGHHASAIGMASLALQKSQNPAVLKLAREIVRAQAQEMYEFQTYLLR